jgi:hypothetical protein
MTPYYFLAPQKIFLRSAESPMKIDMHDQFVMIKIPHKVPKLLPYINTEIESIVRRRI